MTDFSKLVPAHVQKLASYKPGKPRRQAELESGMRCIKVASNENPFGPSPLAIEAIKAAAQEVNFYPDNGVTELTARLAEIHGIETGQILVTAGSSALLDIMARTLLGPGLNAITSKLSFIVYPIVTRATGAQFIEVPTLNDGYDLDRILAAVDVNTRLIYLANPNNPTGTILDANAIDCFLDRLPSHVITVLDEAYCDYASYFAAERGFAYSHALDYVRQQRRVVVLRTIYKAQGKAGPGGVDGPFRAHEDGIHGFLAGRGGSAGGVGRHRPRSASGADKCRRSEVADQGHLGHGNSRDSHVDEFPFLPGRRRCGRPLPGPARRRHHRSSHEWIVGSVRCVSRNRRHSRAEPAVPGGVEAGRVADPSVAVISFMR
jgi:hypothetical protein